MNSKICLLLTDDPDDQQSFSNALTDVAPDAVLITVIDSSQALKLLHSKRILPDAIFLDISMYGINVEDITSTAKGVGELKNVPLALYGYQEDASSKLKGELPYMDKDSTYSDLIKFIRSVLR